MERPLVIAVVGLTGSGKSDATEHFIGRGFMRVGFNDPLYEELERRGLPRVQEHERPVREELRRDFGMGVMATRALPRVEVFVNEGKPVLIESMYSWSEYKIVKERFGDDFKVLAIYSPPVIRYDRLSKRKVRPLTFQEAQARDYAEIENIEKAGPIAMADWTIVNIKPRNEFLKEVGAIIDSLVI
jgi:dephospho-CoA kinase